jgi:CheY-like chemotaxis protein
MLNAPPKTSYMKKLKTILLVEDNQKDVELTLEAISDRQLANLVTVVNDGVEALEYLRKEGKFKLRKNGDPAVVLLDIKMPRMDGIEVLQAIRNDPALKQIPVVMLTSSREKGDLLKCYELGVNAFVVKPVDYHEFIDTIRSVSSFWASINELPQFDDI